MKLKFIFFALFVFLLNFQQVSYATVRYAEETGKDCAYCHKSEGGGELNDRGVAYSKSLNNAFSFKRLFRFTIYYLHLFFAIMWFGTILYVHIILKPGYAAKGLPRGELMLGWLSIFVMFVTGFTLTFLHFDTLSQMISTRFGLILLAKIIIFVLMVFSATFVTFFLGPKMRERLKSKQKDEGSIEFYDGKDGRKAYVYYNGKVFDVTVSKLWKNGVHMMRHNAGTDLTEALKQAPHTEELLLRFPEVQLDFKKEKEKDSVISIFYIIAYTNLAFVFIIIFLVALWKW